jgi:hypothetical protein
MFPSMRSRSIADSRGWPIPDGGTIDVPTAHAAFPTEMVRPPRSLAEKVFIRRVHNSAANAVRSCASSSGCSRAAKCPPLGITVLDRGQHPLDVAGGRLGGQIAVHDAVSQVDQSVQPV